MEINLDNLVKNHEKYLYLLKTSPALAKTLFDTEQERTEFVEKIKAMIKERSTMLDTVPGKKQANENKF